MDLQFDEIDIDEYIKEIRFDKAFDNSGGMGQPDMFTLWLVLKRIKPSVVIESHSQNITRRDYNMFGSNVRTHYGVHR